MISRRGTETQSGEEKVLLSASEPPRPNKEAIVRKNRSERGTALLIRVITALVIMGIGGAFLTETVFRSKQHFKAMRADETRIACDAAVERARLALLQARNLDPSAWNYILSTCYPTLVTWTPEAVRNDYVARRTQPAFVNYTPAKDAILPALAGSGPSMVQPLFNGDPASGALAVFNQNVPIRNGAVFIQIKNNVDIHGDGIDDNGDGDLWDPDTSAELAAGATSPVIDGDKQVYIIVTVTLGSGEQRRVEALVRYSGAR